MRNYKISKVVRLNISDLQREIILSVTGKSNLGKGIESYISLNLPPSDIIDKSDVESVVLRLGIDTYNKLMSLHKTPYKALMLAMGINRLDVDTRLSHRQLIITESQRAALGLLGNGSVEEGLKSLIGE